MYREYKSTQCHVLSFILLAHLHMIIVKIERIGYHCMERPTRQHYVVLHTCHHCVVLLRLHVIIVWYLHIIIVWCYIHVIIMWCYIHVIIAWCYLGYMSSSCGTYTSSLCGATYTSSLLSRVSFLLLYIISMSYVVAILSLVLVRGTK